MNLQKLVKIFSTPLIISTVFFNINPELNKVKSNNKLIPADVNDLALYQGMGISYVCTATRKGIDFDFRKSLSVASTTFVTIVQQKHGGLIFEGKKKKEKKVDPNTLYQNVSFRLIGGALDVCPNSVPDKIENEFKTELKRIQKLNKK
tara:strand:+ start:696 stop:1139 length:444 start_codon:yes stop_codon:yes gene_type:complete